MTDYRIVYADTLRVGDLFVADDEDVVYHIHDTFAGDLTYASGEGPPRRFLVVKEGTGEVGEIDLPEFQVVKLIGQRYFNLEVQ